MNSTYAQKSSTVQKVAASNATSVLYSSAQNESLQRKADMANNAAQRAEAPRPNNTGMPDNLKAGIESLSGFSMDNVRVHYNSSKPATVQALAYTQGTDINVAHGQEKCLPHEAWHVAQQMAGRVSPTTNINGMPVNDNAALEHEADVMGEKAVQCKGLISTKKNEIGGVLQNIVWNKNVLQRNSYWEWNQKDGNYPIIPQNKAPSKKGSKYFYRICSDLNDRLYETSNAAQTAANNYYNIQDDPVCTIVQDGNGAGQGAYYYYDVNDDVNYVTIANHTDHKDCVLFDEGKVKYTPINHWHTGKTLRSLVDPIIYKNARVGNSSAHIDAPEYNPEGISHYLVRPERKNQQVVEKIIGNRTKLVNTETKGNNNSESKRKKKK